MTALDLADKEDHEEIMKYLTNIPICGLQNIWTEEIISSARKGDLNRVQKLLRIRADPNDAIYTASFNGPAEVVRALLGAGAMIDHQVPRINNTAFHGAEWQGKIDVVKVLVEAGADIGIKNDNDETALDVAIA